MPDDTTQFQHENRPTESATEQVRELIEAVKALTEHLRRQQEHLRQYGMNLPSGSLDALSKMRYQLDVLGAHALGMSGELRQLRGLAETTSLINSSLDTSDVLNQVIDKVVQLTGAERGYIVLKNESTGVLEFRVARGIDQEQLEKEEFIISDTIINRVATSGEPILTHNALDDPRYQAHESIVGFMLRSILAVPLRVQHNVIGVVYCDNRARAGLFKEHELNLLEAFAHQAAVAIQNARLFEAQRAQLAEITEIRDLMDNIFSSVASGLITLNRANIITAYNNAAEAIIGVGAADALGKPLEVVIPMLPPDFAGRLEAAQQLDAQGQIEVDVTLEAPARYWRVKLSALRDANGYSEGVVMVLDDMTETHEQEAQLKEVERYMVVPRDTIRTLDTSTVVGQDREISIVFADVRGFSTFSEWLAPEALMQIINEYLSRASDAIELYDGVIDKYMGDAVTGLFNTQLNPQTDHALRAVRSATSMLYDIAELHRHLPEEQRLFYGIGVHTGIAVLGSVGSPERREFSAIGDAMDMGTLLQENAQRGEILVSEQTYEQVKDYFNFEALTPRITHGREDFTVMYRLLSMKRRA